MEYNDNNITYGLSTPLHTGRGWGRVQVCGCLACLLLSSCGIYTNYKPATEVPEGLYGEEVAVTDTTNMANVEWRTMFTDPALQSLIEKALAQNTDLQSARLRVEAAEANLLAAKLAYLPSFALAPQGTMASFDKQAATETYTLPMVASWQLDLFGGIRNAKKQSKALLEQSKDYRQAVQTQLIAGMANTYYTLLMLDEQLAISEKTAQSWREGAEAMRALMQAGMANEAAASQMEAACHAVNASVLDLKEQVNKVENAICLMLGEAPHAVQRGKLDAQRMDTPLSVGVPVQMLANRPDVRIAERTLEAAFYGTNAARSAFWPNITLSGTAGWTNSAGSMIINPAKFVASAVGQLTQPLFAQGKLRAQYKNAKVQQETASLAFQQTLLNAGAEVNEALVHCQTANEKATAYDQQVKALERAYESTSLTMQYGNTTYLEVLTAQQSLLSAQLQQVANRFAQLQGTVNLYAALGGGGE